MILNKKHGYLIQWLIGVGDLIVLNLLFMAVFHLLGPKYTEAISYNLREVILLLNFCYFFSLYFIPIQLHQAVVFIDKIVQRAFGLVTVLIFLFATCLIFLNVGDILATGFWAARISEIQPEDTVLIIGAGPTGICTLLCAMLQNPKAIIVCEKEEERRLFLRKHYPKVLACTPEECEAYVLAHSEHGGADVVIEAAGTKDTFELAWKCARPNAIVTSLLSMRKRRSSRFHRCTERI